jgi:hypothetical protein
MEQQQEENASEEVEEMDYMQVCKLKNYLPAQHLHFLISVYQQELDLHFLIYVCAAFACTTSNSNFGSYSSIRQHGLQLGPRG